MPNSPGLLQTGEEAPRGNRDRLPPRRYDRSDLGQNSGLKTSPYVDTDVQFAPMPRNNAVERSPMWGDHAAMVSGHPPFQNKSPAAFPLGLPAQGNQTDSGEPKEPGFVLS
ncbi:hypothetical protein AAFF_G00163720 [Aldrovandia affinis]|uniref:Uncharacterized protein n=1 Tax=Aldrovandia affinis TaxID=143900 RepID=A0AAD7SZC2_9TELE|nr:hypothetical protein AAFF_G00163720 [Aldrovandia affinis]